MNRVTRVKSTQPVVLHDHESREWVGGDRTAVERTLRSSVMPHTEKPLPLGSDPGVGNPEVGHVPILGPRIAYFITVVVTLGFCIMAVAWVGEADGSFLHVEIAVGCSAALLVLQLGYFARGDVDLHSRQAHAVLVAQTALSFLPVLILGYAWISMQIFAAANALLVVSRRWRWWVWAVEILAVAGLSWWYGDPLLGTAYITLVTAQTSLVLFGLVILRMLVQALYATHSEVERALVTAERLRFARDVHDLLGSYLSTLVLKCELLRRIPTEEVIRSSTELGEITALSRIALGEARSVVLGDNTSTLAEEIQSAVAVLASAGVRAESSGANQTLPEVPDQTLATVVREAVTNVVRHAEARWCEIKVVDLGDRIVLTVGNDGVTSAPGTPGSGLDNLGRRMHRIGGSLSTGPGPASDTFQLVAEAPYVKQGSEPRPWYPRNLGRLLARADAVSDVTSVERLSTAKLPPYLLGATLAGYFGIGLVWILNEVLSTAGQMLALLSLMTMTAGVVALSSQALGAGRRWAVLATIAVAYLVVPLTFGNLQLGAPGLLAGAVLLVVRPQWAAGVATAVFVLLLGWIHYLASSPGLNVIYATVSAGMSGLVIFGVVKMGAATEAARRRSAELAAKAVAEERLGFEHDLNEALGRTLSKMVAHAESSEAALRRGTWVHSDEADKMIKVAREGLAEIRAMGVSYRLRSGDHIVVTSTLEATGVDMATDFDLDQIPAELQPTLMSVFRDDLPELVCHSNAERCAFSVRRDCDLLIVTISTWASGSAQPGFPPAVASLERRLSAVGGRLGEEHLSGDRSDLVGQIPLR